ncbi:MAG: flagellar basal-body rod protein FlgG [Campylobacterota bacterium]|nr:flagellar basal-body rod protein FlgG [Campylobacterota bacterium]
MIKGLYTAASGMTAQQSNIDVISNNIANVNTSGFKQDRAEFQDLMYQSMNYAGGATSVDTNNPTGIDVGLGVKLSGVQKNFLQGSLKETGNPLDIAISGKGFFKITTPNGETAYTRNGEFKLDSEGAMVNGQGFKLDPEIVIGTEFTNISISEDGTVTGMDSAGAIQQLGQINIVSFINPAGLSPQGSNLYLATDASGDPQEGVAGIDGLGKLTQGMTESSNVELVKEMVNLITAQRAYEANSKSISTTDTMLQTVNQLKK